MTRPPSQWPFMASIDPLDSEAERILDEMYDTDEERRKPRYCSECRQTEGHAAGCPAADDEEGEE